MIIPLNAKWRMQWDGLQFNIETHSSPTAEWKANYHYRDPWRGVLFVLEKELERIPRQYSLEAVKKLADAAYRIQTIGGEAKITIKRCLEASQNGADCDVVKSRPHCT